MVKRYGHVTVALLLVAALLLNMCLIGVNVSPVQAQPVTVKRDEIIWGAGYWPEFTNFNPIKMNDGMGWDTYLMYEPLFVSDVASNTTTGWLAEKAPEWDPTGTILTITLRKGIYWVKVADWNGWLEGTYTPEKYRDINTTDVRYSWLLLGAFPESLPAAGYMAALKDRMSAFQIVDARTFKVYLKPAYAFSSIAYRTITRGFQIVPFDIWQQINETMVAAGKTYLDFTNNWLAADFNPDWRVASGLFLSWWRNPELTQTICKKNDNWWGIKVFGRQPAPKYMGYYRGLSNIQIEQMLKEKKIDWDGSYVPGCVNGTWPGYEFLRTYFKTAPYFPDKSALLMVPNYRKWPICEEWLHWAIALTMDYPANSEASSNYCVDGSIYHIYGTDIQYPNAFLIPKDDVIANKYLVNYPNRDKYLIKHNVTKAVEILFKNCYYIYNGEIQGWNPATNRPYNWPNGDWYTKGDNITAIREWAYTIWDYFHNNPACSWFNNDPPLVIGTVKKKASEWLANFEVLVWEADQLNATIPGVNVMLGYSDYPTVGGPWTIIDMPDWTDVWAIDQIVAATINDDPGSGDDMETLDIPFAARPTTWDQYTDWTTGEMQTYVYDFADFCMHWGINGDLYERYAQLFTCWSGCWNHYNGYANYYLEYLINRLDVEDDPQAVANKIFDIVGEELPYIPESGHPDWYIYSIEYWSRWPNEDHVFLPASPYGGAAQEGNVLYILMALGSSHTYGLQDINNDHIVDMKDIRAAAAAFLAEPGDLNWDFPCDVTGGNLIDMKDIRNIAAFFLCEWSFSDP